MPPKRKAAPSAAPAKASEAVSTILPSALYLGPCSAASSEAFLTANNIKRVLSIGITASPKVENVTYHRLTLLDSTNSSVTDTLNSAIEIIDGTSTKSKKGPGAILVHCSAGVSRSPTIVIGYLMKQKGMSLKEALGLVVRNRPQVSPNSGFLQQLKDLELELYGTSSLDVEELPRREIDRLALFQVEPAPA